MKRVRGYKYQPISGYHAGYIQNTPTVDRTLSRNEQFCNCACSAQGDIQGLVSMNLHSATQCSHCYCRTGIRRLLNKRQIHLSSRLDTPEFLPSPTVCQGLPPFARLYVRIYRSDRFTCATIDWLVGVFSLLVYVWNLRPPPPSLPRHLNPPFHTLGESFIQRHVSLMYATIDRPMISFNDWIKAPMDST